MTDPNRRRFLIATAGATTAALAGCLGGDDDNDDGDDDGNGDDGAGGIEIEPGTTIELEGFATHWEGVAPAAIEGEENPTLQLSSGEEYEFEWVNGDGVIHDIQIWDAGGNLIDDLASDEVDAEGDSATLTFTATEEMAEYVCSFHRANQAGDLVVE